MLRWTLIAWLGASVGACVQPPPHANLVVHGNRQPTSHAVLSMPTACVSTETMLCNPTVYTTESFNTMRSIQTTFASYVDPALRLKLELAGFTLAEAGAMRLVTADRVDVNGDSRQVETAPGPQTVAELPLEDVRGVAASLALTSILAPTLTIVRKSLGEVRGDLVVTLLDVQTMRPRWTVTCSEPLYDVIQTTNRLANCAGNGVLAVLAPDNLIGKAL